MRRAGRHAQPPASLPRAKDSNPDPQVQGLLCFPLHQPEMLARSEEHTSELQSLRHIVCRLLLEKKNADNRPLLVMRSNLWASGYDVDGTDQTSLGQFSGRVQQTYTHSVQRFVVPDHGTMFSSVLVRFPPTATKEIQYLIFFFTMPHPPRSTLFPYTTLFR